MDVAIETCMQLQEGLSALTFDKYPEQKLTASFGLASCCDSLTAARLFINADQAMYQAKRTEGGICIFDCPTGYEMQSITGNGWKGCISHTGKILSRFWLFIKYLLISGSAVANPPIFLVYNCSSTNVKPFDYHNCTTQRVLKCQPKTLFTAIWDWHFKAEKATYCIKSIR